MAKKKSLEGREKYFLLCHSKEKTPEEEEESSLCRWNPRNSVSKSAHGRRRDSETSYEVTVFSAIPDYSMGHTTCVSSTSSISIFPFPGVF